ncbi:MAG: multicopper oxidase domain-containing protein [Xenococcaceae cyanobacterium MO_188.B29]|nr:multicopper oxidase domain-containing protein [Xenococcaceae cyanobacterium MO_188.B29]
MLKNLSRWLGLALGVAICLLVIIQYVAVAKTPVREYWLKAEEIYWDYASSYPTNEMTGQDLDEDQLVFLEKTDDRIGRIYRKSVFRSYTPKYKEVIDGPNEVIAPETGQKKIIRQSGSKEEHLGIMGPVVRAEVGDKVRVHLKNETNFPVSFHVHGFLYTKANEGSPYNDGSLAIEKQDDNILPGESYTYNFEVPERAGPGPNDVNSVIWPYHSHVDEVRDTNSGLMGAIIVYGKGSLDRQTGLPKGIDREFISLFKVMDENISLYIDENIEQFAPNSDPEDEDFEESNLMHGINGLLYGNLKGLDTKEGEKIRWYLMGMGTEVDIHTPHWDGQTLIEAGHRVNTAQIFPATVKSLDMTADRAGTWQFSCHVNDHISAGMKTTYTINPA